MSLRVDEARAEAIRKVMELTAESTKAGAIDAALHHYIRDHRNKQAVISELDAGIVERLSTTEPPMDKHIETRVGVTNTD